MNSTTTTTSTTTLTSVERFHQLSDDLVVRAAIDAASRRIAAGYAR